MIRTDARSPHGIVWLASYPKSGNTWLRVFLYHLLRIASGLPREDNELNRIDRASIYEARQVALFDRFLGKPLASASLTEVMRIRPRLQAAIAAEKPGARLVKTHSLLGQVMGAPTINMAVSVGAVYVVRDPRDVVRSLAVHIGATVDRAIEVMNTRGYATNNSAVGAGEVWGSWSEHVRSWTAAPDETVLVIRYEDMLAKPDEIFAKVLRHIRLPGTAAQIAEAVALSSFDELQRQEDKTGFKERSLDAPRFFVEGKAGAWRDRLTAEQTGAIAKAHGEQMARFAYGD